MLTVNPAARAVPFSVLLQLTVAFPVESIVRQEIVIFSGVVEYGAMIVVTALKKVAMSELLTEEFCATRLAIAPTVSVTLRSMPMPCEISTLLR